MNSKKKTIILSILGFLIGILSVIGIGYAYFMATIGSGSKTDVDVTSSTSDKLTFTKGDNISLNANQFNFIPNGSDLSTTTTSSATLVANSNTKTAADTYQAYFNIIENGYTYTKDTSTPEIILTVTKPDGTELTAVEGLSYVTISDTLKGFDITTKSGLFTLAKNYAITSNNFTAGVTQEWIIKITYRNLDTNQEANEGKSLNAEVLLQKGKIEIPVPLTSTLLVNNGGASEIEAKGVPDFSKMSPTFINYTDTNFNGSASSRTPTAANYFTYADSYTFNDQTGYFSLTNPQVCQYSSCYAILANKYVESSGGSSNSEAASSTYLSRIYKIETATSTTLTIRESSKKQNPDMSDKGMYAAQDDYGTSYYFRGAVDNNWIKFAGFYWRIIRINGDGSVRMIYTGIAAPTESQKVVMIGTGTQLSTTDPFNSSLNDNMYVGYMYTSGEVHGTGTSSSIKTTIDTWYASKLASYSNYLSDTIFCNDRTAYTNHDGTILGGGTGTTDTFYGPGIRTEKSSPILTCPNKSDAFTVNDTTKGNGALTYPVGLITADEVVMAGGAYADNSSNYLYTNNYYWTGSPYLFSSSAGEFAVDWSGRMLGVHGNLGVRPIVSLTSNIQVTGSGTWDDPYVVQ